jgi:hypothetical protein
MTTGAGKVRDYQIEAGEKITPVMIYTQTQFVLGDVVTKEAIRVSTWLRSAAAPKYIYVRDVQLLTFGGAAAPKPQSFHAILMPTRLVIAFHIKPPAHDSLDYDPTEANRKMDPTTALVGSFQFNGTIRMSTQTSLDKFLDVAKDTYTSMYEIEITNPMLPQMGVIKAPFAMLNNDLALYSPR